MKKVFCILSILTIISPAFADDVPTPVPGDPGSTVAITDQTKAANVPGYNLINSHDETDGNAASAGYVKGAYNATIRAVNMVADQKQNKLGTVAPDKQDKTNGDMYSQDGGLSDGNFVTSVEGANGVVTVTRKEVTIPIGRPTGTAPANRAPIWIE